MYIVQDYDNALQRILDKGVWKENRTGVRTKSIFGLQCRYDISEHFPILTKRKMFPKSIFAELLWILSGSTNVNDLEKMGSRIWSAWRDKNFEEKNGYEDGFLGPIYGFQLRHFGGDYKTQSGGFDQLEYVVNELKNNSTSRRILFSYWCPAQVLSEGARLPPCHHTCAFSVDDDKLSGMLFQRSADFVCGVPANFQFYSALIYMLAQQVGLKPGEFIHSTADSHVYEDQIPAALEYLSRPQVDSPKLKLNKSKDIYSYQLSDFELEGYAPLDKIVVPVAV